MPEQIEIAGAAVSAARIETITVPLPVIRQAELAVLLGFKNAAYMVSRLDQLTNFPPRLPGLNAWSTQCVMRWLATNGQTYLPGETASEDRFSENQLERRYGREARQ